MAQQSESFGRLLKAGVGSIGCCEGKTAARIEEDQGALIGLAGPTIQRYKAGYLPPESRAIEILATACVRRGLMGREWLQRFLFAARYPQADTLLRQLFPPVPERTHPQRIFENLPAPTYSQFVDRRRVFLEVLDGLQQRSSIVLIVGLGGSGKTSMAREVAWHCLEGRDEAPQFQAAVWVSDKDRPGTVNLTIVLNTIARTLDYPGFIQLPHEEKLYEIEQLLRGMPTLLVLDNAESITDTALMSWLLRLPEPSKALITTRDYRREWQRSCWPVELRGLEEQEAQLFIAQQARRLKLEQQIQNTANIDALLILTGANPKALELTLGVLKHGSRTFRQLIDDLRAARGEIFDDLFASAWELLDQPARSILLALPCFANLASQAALAAAADVAGYRFEQAIERLTALALVDVSLEERDESPRYALHPLVRAFAGAKLAEQREWERATRERLSHFFLMYVEQCGDDDLGGEIGDGRPGNRQRLEAEIANLFLAIDWSFTWRPAGAVRMVERITTFLLDSGYWRERVELCTRALAVAVEQGNVESQAGLLARLGWSYLVQGDLLQAREALECARIIAQDRNLLPRLSQIFRDTSMLYARLGEYSEAEQWCAAALEISQRIDDRLGVLEARFFSGRTAYFQGAYTEAKSALLAVLPEGRAEYPRQGIAMLRFLANIAIAEREPALARTYLDEAFGMLTSYPEEHEVAQLCQSRGMLERELGNLTAARNAHKEAMRHMHRLGMRIELAELRALWADDGEMASAVL